MTNSAKITLGILGAAAAGIVIGMLIAPEKGTEMRRRIRRTAGEWADNLTHLFQDGKEEVEHLKDKARQAKSTAEEKANKIKESFS